MRRSKPALSWLFSLLLSWPVVAEHAEILAIHDALRHEVFLTDKGEAKARSPTTAPRPPASPLPTRQPLPPWPSAMTPRLRHQVAAMKDEAPADVQTGMANIINLDSISVGGGLI